jgi:hypothetical protein
MGSWILLANVEIDVESASAGLFPDQALLLADGMDWLHQDNSL